MFFQIFSRDDLRRSRLWMLLWLLPYLVFSVWSTPLHIHTPDGREVPLAFLLGASSSTRSAHESQLESSSHNAKQVGQQVGHSAQTQSAGECFLCEWSAHASALSVAVPFNCPTSRAEIVSLDAPSSPRFFLAHVSRNRGPPSSPLSL